MISLLPRVHLAAARPSSVSSFPLVSSCCCQCFPFGFMPAPPLGFQTVCLCVCVAHLPQHPRVGIVTRPTYLRPRHYCADSSGSGCCALYCVEQWFSKCGVCCVIRVLVRNADLGASPQTHWIRNSGMGPSNQCLNKPCR